MYFKTKSKTRKLIEGSAMVVGFIMIFIFSVAVSMFSAWVWSSLISWALGKFANVHEFSGTPTFPILFAVIFIMSIFSGGKSKSEK